MHIDIKKLLQLLAGQQVNPTKALCSECPLALRLPCAFVPGLQQTVAAWGFPGGLWLLL